MTRTLAGAVVALLLLAAPWSTALAQEDEEYRFDGVADEDPQPDDPTDWMTSVNWSDGGADPLPPFGPEIPDFGTSAVVITDEFGVNAPMIGPGDVAEAFDVRIGRFAGTGLLTMTGGMLTTVDSCLQGPFTCNRRIRVGAAQVELPANRNPGTFNLMDGVVTTDTLWIGSGSTGMMNMSGGVVNTRSNLSFDWTFDAGSTLNMTGGVINVGTDFPHDVRMYRNSVLNLDGGEIFIAGDANFGLLGDINSQGGEEPGNVTVTITDGLLQANDSMLINGAASVMGGILRAGDFDESASTGAVEVGGSGLLQFNNASESVAAVEALISAGTVFTNDPSGLLVSVVDVDGTDFTQVAVASTGTPGDFNDDGLVNARDLLVWQQGIPDTFGASDLTDWEANYGTVSSHGSMTSLPEPTSAASILIGLAMLMGKNRKRQNNR